MDSNQTLTASCRADVWAGATFKPEDTERRGIDGREITSKVIRHMGKDTAEHKKNKAEQKKKSKGIDERVRWRAGTWLRNFTFTPSGPTATLNDKIKIRLNIKIRHSKK